MKNACKLVAGLALASFSLTAYAQTTPQPQDRPSTDAQMMDKKMHDGKMKGKMKKDKMGDGKMMKKENMAGEKTKTKM